MQQEGNVSFLPNRWTVLVTRTSSQRRKESRTSLDMSTLTTHAKHDTQNMCLYIHCPESKHVSTWLMVHNCFVKKNHPHCPHGSLFNLGLKEEQVHVLMAARRRQWESDPGAPGGTRRVTHAGCWWRRRSWERDPAWCSSWRWDGPLAGASEPVRRFPVTETGQPTLHSLGASRQKDRFRTRIKQEA